MRPLPRLFRATYETLVPLLVAIPRAWATGRVFRLAAPAAGLALATLIARPWLAKPEPAEGHLDVPSSRASLPPQGARYEDPDLLQGSGAMSVPSGPLPPSRSLEGLPVDMDLAAPVDPFGTEPQPIGSLAFARVATLAPWHSLVGPVVAQVTAGPACAADAPPQAQLDRIEVKLDALLQRLGTGPNVGDTVPEAAPELTGQGLPLP